jgi:hypothetical protein
MVFLQNNDSDNFYPDYPQVGAVNPNECAINLKWDAVNNRHESMDWALVVDNTANGGNEIDFIKVVVPSSMILAHELGHFLYALELPQGLKGRTLFVKIQNRAHDEYREIFNGVVNLSRKRSQEENLFIRLWNHGNYADTINILPAANILSQNNPNRLCYSDGIMTGEALDPNNNFPIAQIQIFDSSNSQLVINGGLNIVNLPSDSFVRFSHNSFNDFWGDFSKLSPQRQTNFKKLVLSLLGKIRHSGGQPLLPGNNTLPRI